jgi:hypothetical protein
MLCARCYEVLTHGSERSHVLKEAFHPYCYELEWENVFGKFQPRGRPCPYQDNVEYHDMEGPDWKVEPIQPIESEEPA